MELDFKCKACGGSFDKERLSLLLPCLHNICKLCYEFNPPLRCPLGCTFHISSETSPQVDVLSVELQKQMEDHEFDCSKRARSTICIRCCLQHFVLHAKELMTNPILPNEESTRSISEFDLLHEPSDKGKVRKTGKQRNKARYFIKQAIKVAARLPLNYQNVLKTAFELFRGEKFWDSRALVKSLLRAMDHFDFAIADLCVVCAQYRQVYRRVHYSMENDIPAPDKELNEFIIKIADMNDAEVQMAIFNNRSCPICGVSILRNYKNHILLHKLKEKEFSEHFLFKSIISKNTPSIVCRNCKRSLSIGAAFQALEKHRKFCYEPVSQISTINSENLLNSELLILLNRMSMLVSHIDTQINLLLFLHNMLLDLVRVLF